jgi:hypothetical protein
MTINKLRHFYQSRPFKPFIIHLADGQEIPIDHPEFIMSSPSGRTVSVYRPDDTLNVIDLLRVTDRELKPSRNGSSRKRRK